MKPGMKFDLQLHNIVGKVAKYTQYQFRGAIIKTTRDSMTKHPS